jgi:Bacterial Ig-like domain
VSRPVRFRKQQSILAAGGTTADNRTWRRRGAALTASGAALVLAAGVAIVVVGSPGSHAAPVTAAERSSGTARQPAVPLRVLSVTPAAGATGVNGAAPIRVQFSAPVAASTPMPLLSPQIAGGWQVQGDTVVFTPAVGYFQHTRVTLKIPGGASGMISAGGAGAGAGGVLASAVTESFSTGGDAVHQFARYSYGWYQSLGCVELPWDAAKTAYSYLSYGSLVTVTGPVA